MNAWADIKAADQDLRSVLLDLTKKGHWAALDDLEGRLIFCIF